MIVLHPIILQTTNRSAASTSSDQPPLPVYDHQKDEQSIIDKLRAAYRYGSLQYLLNETLDYFVTFALLAVDEHPTVPLE